MDAALREAHREALERALDAGHVDAVEEKVLALSDAAGEEGGYLVGVIERLGAMPGQREQASLLALTLAPALREAGLFDEGLQCLLRASRWGAPEEDLRDEAQRVLAARYGERSGFEFLLERCGLPGGRPFREALDIFDRSVRFQEGDAAWHGGGWGYGRIAKVDPIRGVVVVDFDAKPGHAFSFDGAADALVRLEPHHWWRRRREESAVLAELAALDPAALVRAILEGLGRTLSVKELKVEITGSGHGPPVVQPAGWTSWWNRARSLVKRDPGLVLEGAGAQATIGLRAVSEDPAEEAAARLAGAENLAAQVAVVADLLDEGRESLILARAEALSEAARAQLADAPADAISLSLLLERAGATAPIDIVACIAGRPPMEGAAILASVRPPAFVREVLKRIRTSRPDGWLDTWMAAFGRTPTETWTAIAEGIEAEAPDRLRATLLDWLDRPAQAPVQAAWVFRQLCAGKLGVILEGLDRYAALLRLLDQADVAARADSSESAGVVAALRPAIGAAQRGFLGALLEGLPYGPAREVANLVRHNAAISESARREVLHGLIARFPDLAGERREVEDDRILSTEAGLNRRRSDLARLINEEIPKNRDDIGRAASFGDLSENAEYTAALERQGLLMKRAASMQAEIEKVHVVPPEEVSVEEVGFGARVELVDVATGERKVYTLLGPWDSDPESGIVSYFAPIGQSLLGAKPGDTVGISKPNDPDSKLTYRVEKIERGYGSS